MLIRPSSPAEAFVVSFWEEDIHDIDKWEIATDQGQGLRTWWNSALAVEWARPVADAPVFSMQRACMLPCADYDTLVLGLQASPDIAGRLCVQTERGNRETTTTADQNGFFEITLPLDGAQEIRRIDVQLFCASDQPMTARFYCLYLRDSQTLARQERCRSVYASDWPGYRAAGVSPAFTPAHNILCDADDWTRIRAAHDALRERWGTTSVIGATEEFRAQCPEEMIRSFVHLPEDTRFCQVRDRDADPLRYGLSSLCAGMILKDAELVNLGVRHALSLLHCQYWDDGFMQHAPGGIANHRCFVNASVALHLALTLDWADDSLTTFAKRAILRRLSEDALGAIQYNTLAYPYIFDCNQLALFSPGRMAASVILEKYYPRQRQYTEIAYHELCENIETMILPDGGFAESPTYFDAIGNMSVLALRLYARARGKSIADVMPASMQRCDKLGGLWMSFDPEHDCIPFGDCFRFFSPQTLTAMSELFPNSGWAHLAALMAMRDEQAGIDRCSIGTPFDFVCTHLHTPAESDPLPEPTSLVQMPDIGCVASHRKLNEKWLKLFLAGGCRTEGHSHEDKGSFVLEYAGETFAMDPGVCIYSDPQTPRMAHAQLHNMLVPTTPEQRPRPMSPLRFDLPVNATGDETALHGTINAGMAWEDYFSAWTREWNSSTPSNLEIKDMWTLKRGRGVAFLWCTELPVSRSGEDWIVEGKQALVTLTPSANAEATLDALPLFVDHLSGKQRTMNQLRLTIPEPSGTFLLRVLIHPKDNT